MDALKEALKRKLEEHMMKQNAHDDMGHRDDDSLLDEVAGNEGAEDDKKLDDMAPELHANKEDMDADRAEEAMPHMGIGGGDGQHEEILKAIADRHSGNTGSLGARAAMDAKAKMAEMKSKKK